MSDDAVKADLPIYADDASPSKQINALDKVGKAEPDKSEAYDVQEGHEDDPFVQGGD